jgi:hypothetical protein
MKYADECKTNHSDRMNCNVNTDGSCVCTCKEGYYHNMHNMEFDHEEECQGSYTSNIKFTASFTDRL